MYQSASESSPKKNALFPPLLCTFATKLQFYIYELSECYRRRKQKITSAFSVKASHGKADLPAGAGCCLSF